MSPLVLASASPRRRSLLSGAGIEIECRPAEIEERLHPGETPEGHVTRLAREKAACVAAQMPQRVVLGADTIVYLDDRIIGKPADLAAARRMIGMLNGKTHQVYTGVCLTCGARTEVWHCVTAVTFNLLSTDDIERYLAEAEPLDKAGAYAIQDHEALLIARYDGLRSNVIGLPLEEVLEKLREFPLE